MKGLRENSVVEQIPSLIQAMEESPASFEQRKNQLVRWFIYQFGYPLKAGEDPPSLLPFVPGLPLPKPDDW